MDKDVKNFLEDFFNDDGDIDLSKLADNSQIEFDSIRAFLIAFGNQKYDLMSEIYDKSNFVTQEMIKKVVKKNNINFSF